MAYVLHTHAHHSTELNETDLLHTHTHTHTHTTGTPLSHTQLELLSHLDPASVVIDWPTISMACPSSPCFRTNASEHTIAAPAPSLVGEHWSFVSGSAQTKKEKKKKTISKGLFVSTRVLWYT